MSADLQLSITFAATAARKGIDRAARTAGAAWSARAYELAVQFIEALPSHRRFMTEQLRAYAYERNLWHAPSERAWGAVTIRLAKEGKIRRVGYEATTNVKAHGTPASVWTKVNPADHGTKA